MVENWVSRIILSCPNYFDLCLKIILVINTKFACFLLNPVPAHRGPSGDFRGHVGSPDPVMGRIWRLGDLLSTALSPTPGANENLHSYLLLLSYCTVRCDRYVLTGVLFLPSQYSAACVAFVRTSDCYSSKSYTIYLILHKVQNKAYAVE